MSFGYLGTMTTHPGKRDEVAALLLRGSHDLDKAGCQLYVVGVSETAEDTIWVTEVWQSKEHHRASLQLPDVRATIAEAMPMLTGEFTGQELRIVGGLGVDAT